MKPYVVRIKTETKTFRLVSSPFPVEQKPILIITEDFYDAASRIAASSHVRHPFKQMMRWQRIRHLTITCR